MLETLVIEELPNLTALPDFIANLNQLRKLEILSCKNVESLGDLRGLTMLESLKTPLPPKSDSLACVDGTPLTATHTFHMGLPKLDLTTGFVS